MNKEFEAMSREAALAAEHIAIGVTALEHADYAAHAYYAQAFFALSIGFERSAKLSIVVDYALSNAGVFPPPRSVKDLKHDLLCLFTLADDIVVRRVDHARDGRLPGSEIHREIIGVLSEFASNVTRYYNLDLLTGRQPPAQGDAVSQWHKRVTERVLELHYGARKREQDEYEARAAGLLLEGHAITRHTSETGKVLNTIESVAVHQKATTFAKPFTRMYVLQLARFFYLLMSTLSDDASKAQCANIPDLSEFYRIFDNDDQNFRRRKKWSIYRP